MSSHTRMMLDKLKQSTSELQGLTDGAEEPVFSPRKPGAERRKKSRFLRPEAEEEVKQKINSYILEFENFLMAGGARPGEDAVRQQPG